ncbi:MAG TPA: acetyltransferase [Clostridiales bacterium]|nr:acetyltransferase [Clostridiales bacterium]
MNDILIFGNGIHACEMVEILERWDKNHEYRLIGFVAKEPDERGLMGYPVFGLDDLDKDGLRYAALVPDNTFDLEVKQKYRGRMITVIDPSCFVSRSARIGPGTVLYPGCYVGQNAVIGEFVFCLAGCIINHDDVIEEGCILASGVRIAGNVRVERKAYLGQACTIRQFLTIGEQSLIGTGAVVVKDVRPNTIVVGNPARELVK